MYKGNLRLLESSKSGKTWKVMLIESGLSKNGLFYPKEVLKRATNIFEGVKACYYEWKKHFDHLPEIIEKIRPEGFPHQVFGFYDNIKYETVEIEGKKKEGLTAFLHIHDGAKWLKEMLTDAWKRGKRNLLGLSINAEGPHRIEFINGRPLDVVKDIKDAFSVDLVTSPAAGGQFARLMASIKKGREENMDWLLKIIGLLKESKPELLEGLDEENLTEEDISDVLTKLIEQDPEKKEEEGDKDPAEKAKADAIAAAKTEGKNDDEAAQAGDAAYNAAKAEAGKVADESVTEAVIAEREEAAGEYHFDEAVKGTTTLKQVIGLLKAKKYPLALALLKKWLAGYPEPGKESLAEAKKKKVEVEDKDKKKKKKKDEKYPEKEESNTELAKKVDDLLKKNQIRECEKILDMLLEGAKLPDAVKSKIKKSFKGKIFEEKVLKEAITDEKDTLIKLSESGDVVDLGNDKEMEIVVGENRRTEVQKSFDLMIDPEAKNDEKLKESFEGVQPFTSLREAYVKITGDTEITGSLPRRRLQEADTSDIPQIIQDAMNKRMAREYKKRPLYYRDLADIVSLKDFKTQHIIRWGGFSALEKRSTTVTPGTGEVTNADYPAIAFPADEEATYDADTYGGLISITRRMIINDDLRALQKIPGKIARAAARALNKFVFDLLLNYSTDINDGTIYDGIALYHINHNNLGESALDFDTYGAMREKLMEQKEFGYEAAITDDPMLIDATEFNVADAATGDNFRAGEYVQIDGEIMGPITEAAGVITVGANRGVWGTDAAEHLQGAVAKVVVDDLELNPGILWTVTDQREVALMIKDSEFVPGRTTREVNPYRNDFDLKVVPRSYMRGDTNNWFMTAKKGDIELMELGFIGGKENPEVFLQDAPGVGLVFTRDVLRYKVRHEYGGTIPDYRGFQGNIVTGG